MVCGKCYRLILNSLVAFISVCFLLISCGKEPVSFTPAERNVADSIVRSAHGIDSLASLQKRLESEGDKLGSVIALRELGKALRNESRFEEALSVHSKGQQQAEAVGDTLEWVQALNNIGTDYRRMGVLDVAQEYHYRAWMLSEECADTSFTARKNRVVSLNGLGNIYMTLGNYERADSTLRMALEGERLLHSSLGQAITTPISVPSSSIADKQTRPGCITASPWRLTQKRAAHSAYRSVTLISVRSTRSHGNTTRQPRNTKPPVG